MNAHRLSKEVIEVDGFKMVVSIGSRRCYERTYKVGVNRREGNFRIANGKDKKYTINVKDRVIKIDLFP